MRSTDLHIASPYTREGFAADVAFYLQQTPRQLPSRYFYDGLGSALFDAICRLPWYWVARAETALLARHAVRQEREIGSKVGLLYATNTAGAVVGALAAGFVLLPYLGLARTLWTAAAAGEFPYVAYVIDEGRRAGAPKMCGHGSLLAVCGDRMPRARPRRAVACFRSGPRVGVPFVEESTR